mgnify:FL=1
MQEQIKCLLLKNGDIIISEIIEVDTELGGPDCKLINPVKMTEVISKNNNNDYDMASWLDFTAQNEMMIHSDSIMTIVAPTSAILSKYLDMIAQ